MSAEICKQKCDLCSGLKKTIYVSLGYERKNWSLPELITQTTQ